MFQINARKVLPVNKIRIIGIIYHGKSISIAFYKNY